MFLIKIKAKKSREFHCNQQDGIPKSAYRLHVRVAVEITQQALHIIGEQRQRGESLPTKRLAEECTAELVLQRNVWIPEFVTDL
jgi:hypothetical protein